METLHFWRADFNCAILNYLNEKSVGKKVIMRLHTAAWLMCQIRGVRLKHCAFNCSWLYWGTPQGMLSDANPLMPYRCDMLAICGQSFSSAHPEVESTFLLLFWSHFAISSLALDVSLYIHQGDFLHFPLLTSESFPGENITQYMLCSGACLLFDLANTWEAFYKLIIPHCINNVLKEMIKMPTQSNKSNVSTSSLTMHVWKTLGADGTWKLQRCAASYEMPLARKHAEPSAFIFIFSTEIWIYGLVLTELWSTCSTDRGR